MQNQPTLFWDFDGTLAHRAGHQRGAMMYALDKHCPGHDIEIDQLKPHLANILPWHMPEKSHHHLNTPKAWWAHIEGIFASAFASVGIVKDTAATLAKITHEHYLNPDEFILFPNTAQVLASLQEKGWQNIILSNHVPELSDIVQSKGLSDYFTYCISSANVGLEKPNIDFFKHAVTLAGNPSKAVMIGDNITADIQGAKNAGLDAILIHTDPDDTIEHFAKTIVDVEAILERMS
ncbi:MAG: HAD-IA family hydrolase [Clostridia bacterium]|jgi:putative hydrolase of the HAD superfamily|nr:HAD-IA family hydrolase [Clostridia bacterium]MBT7123088.1 HAD-IA family hydrolase [Clostridia bacterium]